MSFDHRGEVPRSWPAWDSDGAAGVKRICARLVAPLANSVPERRDPRLVDAFTRICADAAQDAYITLTLEEARAFVADFDRRFPGWKERLRNAGS